MSTISKTVFIVDDEPLLTDMLTDYLTENFPYLNVHSFSTGEEAIHTLGQNPDLLILDYYLNSREQHAADGLDILKQIKKIHRPLPVVMLSSQTDYGVAAQTIAKGAIFYVIKGETAFEEIGKVIKANV